MSTTYYFYVGPIVPGNIATLVSLLNARLLVELDLPVANYTSTTYNSGTQNVEVIYSVALSSDNQLKLNNITDIILFGADASNWYADNLNLRYRKSLGVTATPGILNDAADGYNNGSMVTTQSNIMYLCTDNTIGAARWIKINTCGPLIAYSLRSNANLTVIANYYPLAFTYDVTTLTSVTSPTILNAPAFKVPTPGTINGLSASVAISTLVGVSLGGTINYTFTIFKASAPNGSTTIPTFSNVGSTVVAMSIPTVTLLTTLFNSNSSSLSINVSQGDLVVLVVAVNNTIALSLGAPALALTAGISMI